jgi:hypothetical protein
MFQAFTFASSLGGAMSLLLGLCGITLIEIALMIWDLFTDLCCNNGPAKKPQQENNNLNDNMGLPVLKSPNAVFNTDMHYNTRVD